jgi:cytochrome c biogenesis protein CcmG, thiol:disulfide interchange protein DsbE
MLRGFTLALAVIVSSACSGRDDSSEKITPADKVEVGSPAPAYSATSMTGDSVSLAGMRGKVVLLNVWATWCGPCRQEIPELRAIQAAYKGRGLELIGVTVDTEGMDEAIDAFTTEFHMQYPIWRDPDERISARFRVLGLPATFLIDRQGILRWKHMGAVPPRDTSLANAINRALGG